MQKLRQFKEWDKVRDMAGYEGFVHHIYEQDGDWQGLVIRFDRGCAIRWNNELTKVEQPPLSFKKRGTLQTRPYLT